MRAFGMKSLAYAVVAVSLIAGCGGQANVSGLTDPLQNFVEGRSALDAALQLPESSNPASALSEATYKLNTSYSQEPTAERGAAYAIAASAKVANEIAQLFGTSVTRSPGNTSNHPILKLTYGLTPWKLEKGNPVASLNPAELLFATAYGESKAPTRAYPDDPTPAQLRGALLAVEKDLRRVLVVLNETTLNAIETNPFVMDDPTSSTPGQNVKVGKSEALMIRSGAQAMLGVIDLVLAYEFGFPSDTFNFEQSLTSAYGEGGQTLVGTDLLPASPFGTLKSDGLIRFASLQSDWRGAGADAVSSMDGLQGRTSSETGTTPWLGEVLGLSEGDIQDTEDHANQVKSRMDSAGLIDFEGDDVTVDFPTFFANPPTLGSLLPGLTVSGSSAEYGFSPVTGSWSSTFGGLFPNGVTYSAVSTGGSSSRVDLLVKLLESLEISRP